MNFGFPGPERHIRSCQQRRVPKLGLKPRAENGNRFLLPCGTDGDQRPGLYGRPGCALGDPLPTSFAFARACRKNRGHGGLKRAASPLSEVIPGDSPELVYITVPLAVLTSRLVGCGASESRQTKGYE